MDKKITRKEAIKKAGVTVLATSSLLLLNTKAHACTSGSTGTGNNQTVETHSREHKKHRRHRRHRRHH